MKRSLVVGLVMLIPLVMFLSGCSKSPQEKRDAYLKSAAEYVKEGKLAEASIQYQNALKIAPDDAATHMALGEVELKRMRGDEAYRAFHNAVRADPKNTKAHEYLAYMQILAKRFDMAEKEAQAILAYDPANRNAREILAQALFNTNRADEAVRIMEELLSDPKPSETNFMNAARMYLGMGRTDDAVRATARGAELYPSSSKIRFLASDVQASRGNLASARTWAEDAYRVDRKNISTGLTLARFYQNHKMDDRFNSLLTELKTSFPKEAGPHLLESNRAHGRGELDKALALAEKARQLQDNAANKTQVAQLLLEKGDTRKAEKLLKEAVEKDGKSIPARILLAQLYLKEKNPNKALETLDVLIKNVPRRSDVATEAAQAYLMKGDLVKARELVEKSLSENKGSVVLHTMMARIHFAEGKYAQTLDEVDLLGRYALVQPDVLYVGVLSAVKLGRKDRASTLADSLKKASPDSWQSLHSASLVALSKGDKRAAYAAAEKAVNLYPGKPQALALYAGTAPAVISKEQAIEKISSVCAKNSTAYCHLILARLLETTGNVDGSLRELKEAIRLDPENASLYHALAQFYAAHNMVRKAMDEYEVIINKNPNDLKAAFMLAQLNQSQGNIADAKKVYSYIIEREPKSALAANNLAWILAENGRPGDLNEALRLAQIAKEKYPEDPRIADTLGYVYLKKGLLENALGQFRLALEKMPQEPSINYHMALALVQLNRGTEARKYAEAALGSKTSFSERALAQKLLADINSGKK
ncbi:MAG TPA: tetratricopeptide repeat protein [Deltaproteobacteria bacterium]|nr:tetratricopeptide repeat protein [Deltaproteobacteria bacterium]HOI05913.1 tetratricopeptide repeat protein [Deltaproteobacteria bacterium]